MRAAFTHYRDGELLDAFMPECEFTPSLDGSEVCRVIFPKPITVLEGDEVRLTYYILDKL
jgi:hypothetical protein